MAISQLPPTITTGFIVWAQPYRLEEKASSVRTSEKKLENYFRKAESGSDFELFSLLAKNQALPTPLCSFIYQFIQFTYMDLKYMKNVKIFPFSITLKKSNLIASQIALTLLISIQP